MVGAGASAEAGLPVGTGLARKIREKLHSERAEFGDVTVEDRILFGQLRRANPNAVNECLQAYSTIHKGVLLANSIDDFLHIHRDDRFVVEVGKAAIVRAILEAEADSDLFVDHSNIYNIPDYPKLADTWYVKLMRILGPGTSVQDVSQVLDNVSFIIFNYDRCIEHFLQFGLQHLYGIKKTEAAKIVTEATIIHPYGSIGSISNVPFGGDKNHDLDYVNLAKRIKTYTEQIEEGEVVGSMKEEVKNAERIVFLGFAFHDQNLALLHPGGRWIGKEVFGTAYGMSDKDTGDVVAWLSELFPALGIPEATASRNHIRLESALKCTALFDSYAKSISG